MSPHIYQSADQLKVSVHFWKMLTVSRDRTSTFSCPTGLGVRKEWWVLSGTFLVDFCMFVLIWTGTTKLQQLLIYILVNSAVVGLMISLLWIHHLHHPSWPAHAVQGPTTTHGGKAQRKMSEISSAYLELLLKWSLPVYPFCCRKALNELDESVLITESY